MIDKFAFLNENYPLYIQTFRKISIMRILFLLLILVSITGQASMYVGVGGGLLTLKKDKASAADATSTNNWPATDTVFNVLKYDKKLSTGAHALIGYAVNVVDFEFEGGVSFLKFASDQVPIRNYILYQLTSIYGMCNVYAKLNNYTPFAPFIGAGFGMSKTYFDASKSDIQAKSTSLIDDTTIKEAKVENFLKIFPEKISKNQFIFQTISGVRVAVTSTLDIKLDWRVVANLTALKFDEESSVVKYIKSPFGYNILNLSVNIKM